jgi:hypothetical protein
MNYIKKAIAMMAPIASAVAQAPDKTIPDKPNLRAPFTKSCLKALLAIGDFKGTAS